MSFKPTKGADQLRRMRDTAAVSPMPVERDDFTFFATLLLGTSRRRVDAAVVRAALILSVSLLLCSVL